MLERGIAISGANGDATAAAVGRERAVVGEALGGCRAARGVRAEAAPTRDTGASVSAGPSLAVRPQMVAP